MPHFTPQEKRLAGILLLFLLVGVTVQHYRRAGWGRDEPSAVHTARR